MPFYGPFSRYTRVSRCSHKGETYWNNHWNFYEPDILPVTQPTKHYRKTQWFGRLLFYRHGISIPCLTNSVKALKEINVNQ